MTQLEFLEHLNIFTQKEWMTGEETKLRRLVEGSVANNTSVSNALKEYDEWAVVYGKRVTRVVLDCDYDDQLQCAFRDKLMNIISPWDDSSYEMARNAMDWLEYEMKTCDTDGFEAGVWEDDMHGCESFYEQIDGEASCYNSTLFDWLSANATHQYYVDEAIEEYGNPDSINRAITLGMVGMAREIYGDIIRAVTEMFDAYYEPEEEEEDAEV